MVFLYVPCKNVEEAKTIGRLMVHRKVAGRIDIMPTQSIFQGAKGPEETDGAAMIISALDKKVQDVEDIVREHHSGRIPCIATFMLYRLNREFKEWLVASTD